jgi:hypothetical protein
MSGFKPVGTELLYSYATPATISVVSASAVTITAGWPAIEVPAHFFSNVGDWSSSLRFKMGGFITTTATVPTFVWGLAAAVKTTPPAFATTLTLGQTAAVIPSATGVTAASWFMELDITLKTITGLATSVLVTMGEVRLPGVTAAPFLGQTIPAANVANTVSTYDVNQPYHLWPFLTMGAATAGNQVTAQYGKLYGDN